MLPETIVIVISPLNALVGDQIDKLKTDMGVKAVVLRHDDHDKEMKGVLVCIKNTSFCYFCI